MTTHRTVSLFEEGACVQVVKAPPGYWGTPGKDQDYLRVTVTGCDGRTTYFYAQPAFAAAFAAACVGVMES